MFTGSKRAIVENPFAEKIGIAYRLKKKKPLQGFLEGKNGQFTKYTKKRFNRLDRKTG